MENRRRISVYIVLGRWPGSVKKTSSYMVGKLKEKNEKLRVEINLRKAEYLAITEDDVETL